MKYYFSAVLLVAALFFSSPVAHAALNDSQIQSIVNLLLSFNAPQTTIDNVAFALRGQTSGTSSSMCPYTWTTYMGQNTSNLYVLKLQQFLNQDPDTLTAKSGAGSPGQETRFYGPATAQAVMKFQKKYGINPVGYVGPGTRAQLNSLCTGTLTPVQAPAPQPEGELSPAPVSPSPSSEPQPSPVPELPNPPIPPPPPVIEPPTAVPTPDPSPTVPAPIPLPIPAPPSPVLPSPPVPVTPTPIPPPAPIPAPSPLPTPTPPAPAPIPTPPAPAPIPPVPSPVPVPTPIPASYAVGDRVVTTANLNVRAVANPYGFIQGTQSTGKAGSVVGGPTISGGFVWWNINYDTGVDGWSVQDYLSKTTSLPVPPPPAPIPTPPAPVPTPPAPPPPAPAPSPVPIPAPSPTSRPVLITAGLSQPKGLDYFQAQDFLTKNGINFFDFAQDWRTLETSPGQYDLQNNIINPLTVMVPKYPFTGVLVVIKMIDTNARTMPADLQNKTFDDPEVRRRFLALLHAIAQDPSAKKITHILLGNEVDAYFATHQNETDRFLTLLKESIDQLHRELPGVKVGTITTFDSLNNVPLFQKLTQYSDFIDYTYYPINGLSGGNVAKGWQMRPLNEIPADLNRMAQSAGSKPFGFTEIGYSASPVNNSSEDLQSDFVRVVFDTLEQYRTQNRVELISWSSFGDYAPEFCAGYASSQGISGSTEFCAFLNNLGLRTYTTNTARKAWNTFIGKVSTWAK